MKRDRNIISQVEQMFSRAIDELHVPSACVLEQSILFIPRKKDNVYECTVLLSKTASLRRFDIEMFESELKDDSFISNLGAWIEYDDSGLLVSIRVIDSWKHAN